MTKHDREFIFQFKKSKSKKRDTKPQHKESKIDFYAAFSNLGPVEGILEVYKEKKSLSLYLYYESSVKFLTQQLDKLSLDAKIYKKDKKIEPFFYVSSNLLDVVG